MSEERKQILYDVLKEASSNVVHVEDWCFRIGFETKITNQDKIVQLFNATDSIEHDFFDTQGLVLEIKNEDAFCEAMNEYVNAMKEHLTTHPKLFLYDDVYYDGNILAQEKYLMATVWSNATTDDFKNPISFLKKQIEYVKATTQLEGKEEKEVSNIFPFSNTKLVYGITTQHPCMETPFVFESYFENENGELYQFPKISFAISNSKCSIYTIQDFENHDRKDSFYKQVKRFLYKTGKGVKDEYFDEKITDVSPSGVCSLALFLGFMGKIGIEEYEVIPYLPLRYQSKNFIIQRKVKKLEEQLKKVEHNSQKELSSLYEYQDLIQSNITNKFIRYFKRIDYHFDSLEITSYPNEIDSMLHFKLPKTQVKNDSLVHSFYHLGFSSLSIDSKKTI